MMAAKRISNEAPTGALPCRLLGFLILLLLASSACKTDKNEYVPPPPPQVTVSHPIQQAVTDYVELNGNLQAYETVGLVARVEGFLTSINFKDGDIVKKGQLLFVIEQQPYEAKLALQKASVQQAKANLLRAQQEYDRQTRLITEKATSQSEVERWRAERDAAKASLEEALANTDLAQINLGYTEVKAPFVGRMERHLVDVGNLVGAGQATNLAMINRIDPIYAYFNLNERDVIRLLKQERKEADPSLQDGKVPVFLALAGEEGYPHRGELDFTSAVVNSTTGTLPLRAIFKNPIGEKTPPELLPGMFARIRIPVGVDNNALLVPQSAIGVNQGREYLLVVNDQNVVEQRPVEIGTLVDNELRVITEGLKADDWVIVDGIQHARPDIKVTPIRKGHSNQEQAQPVAAPSAAPSKPSVKP